MKNVRKMNAFLITAMFVISSLTVLVTFPAAFGDEVLSGSPTADQITAVYNDDWMEDDPLVSDVDEPIVINCDHQVGIFNMYDSMFYLGDDNRDVYITFRNGVDALDDVTVTLTTLSSTPPNPITVDVQTDTWAGVGAWAPSNSYTAEFTVDIGNSGVVEHAYPMRAQVSYDFGGQETQTLDFEIYVSSVWEDDSDDPERDTHDGLPDLGEFIMGEDFPFEAGERFQEGEMQLTDHANEFDPEDVWGNITAEPTDITISQGTTDAFVPGAWSGTLDYRVDVQNRQALPGYKTGGMIYFHYTRGGLDNKRITESARSFGAYVDFTPRLVASAPEVTINQNDLQAEMQVTFTNDGNVDLLDLVITPDPDGKWLDVKFHHYENEFPVYLNQMEFQSLDADTSTSAQPVVIATNMMLPNGTHRVPFMWSARYFNNGLTGVASGWIMAGGEMIDHDTEEDTQEIGIVYTDTNENGQYDGEPIQLQGIEVGTYVDFKVLDNNGLTWTAALTEEIFAGRDDPGTMTDADVTYVEITFEIYNAELVDYKDLVVELVVGPGTPFFDPANHAATSLMMEADSDTTIDPDSTAEIDFIVDVNMAWWQENSDSPDYLKPETYMVNLIVDATNNHDEVRVEDVTIPAQVNINGFGPELFASMVSTSKITPGESFTLTVTITNYGDDIAREVDAYLRADFVSGWQVVDEFTSSISSYGEETVEWYDMFSGGSSYNWSRGNNIRPGEIGVDNVPQIVELHDWITRRETPPQGVILWMHRDRLEPGATWSVEFEMISDVNMVEGMVYYEVLELYYVDSNGETYGPNGAPVGNVEQHYTPPQEVLIRTGKGVKYDAEAVDFSVVLYAIISS
jgi:hypothetical protein